MYFFTVITPKQILPAEFYSKREITRKECLYSETEGLPPSVSIFFRKLITPAVSAAVTASVIASSASAAAAK
jgi:hypothetical protein